MAGEIPELQVDVAQDGEQLRLCLEQIAQFIRAFFRPALVTLANRDRHAIPTLFQVVILDFGSGWRLRSHGHRRRTWRHDTGRQWACIHTRRHRRRRRRSLRSHALRSHTLRRHRRTLGALCLRVHRKRRIEHDGARVVFRIQQPSHSSGPVIDIRNQVQHNLGFVGQADLSQIINKVARSGLMLLLQRHHGPTALGIRGLLAERTLVGSCAFVNELPCLLQQQHAWTQAGRIDLRALRRGRRRAVQGDVAVAQVGEVADVGQLPFLLVAFFLALDHRIRSLGFKAGHLDSTGRAVVQQPDSIFVRLNHADPAPFAFKRNQFPANDRNDGDVAPILRLGRFEFFDGVNDRPIQHRQFFVGAAGLVSHPGRAAFGNLVVVTVRPVVQQHPALRRLFQPIVFRHADSASCAFVA